MKRLLILGLTVSTISLTACEKESNTSPDSANTAARVSTTTGGKFTVVTADQLPASIKTYIQNQYADATINHAGRGPRGNYGIMVEQAGVEKVLLFKGDGTFIIEHDLKVKPVDASALPALATKYLKKNYASSTVQRVLQGPKGNYGVLLQTGTDYQLLAFTKNGLFLKEVTAGTGEKEIDASALPPAISTYITSNYVGSTIRKAGQGPKGKYGVVIEVAGKRKLLIFDETGTFLRELGR